MSNAIAKKDQAQVPQLAPAPDVGQDELLSGNIVIPRLLLMQGLSEFVNEKKAQQGDFVRTTPFQILGSDAKPVQFIPLTLNNQWLLQEAVSVGKGKTVYEFRGYEPMTAKNQDLPWTFQENGTEWKRTKVLNVYALLPADIVAEREELKKAAQGQMPDPNKALLPVLISFRSTSFSAGKDVVTHFARARKFNLPPYCSVLELGAYQDKNDQGTFYVMQVKGTDKMVSKEDQEVAKYWADLLRTAKNVSVEEDETEKTGPARPGRAPQTGTVHEGDKY